MSATKVLLVDQGIGFGGALVVIARLANCLDPSAYSPVLISAAPKETIDALARGGFQTIKAGNGIGK